MLLLSEIIVVSYFARQFGKLGELIPKQLLFSFVKVLPGNRISRVEDKTCLCEGRLPPEMVLFGGDGRIVICIGIPHGRNELVFEASP